MSWLVTISAEGYVGWLTVSKEDADTAKRAVQVCEDMMCAAGPDILEWEGEIDIDVLIDACMGWDLLSVVDTERYPLAAAELGVEVVS